MDTTDFADFLRTWLERRGWNQARLAAASGINQSLISKHLSRDPNRRVVPTPLNLERYAEATGVPHSELMRLCDYLIDPTDAAREIDEAEAEIRAWIPQIRSLLEGIPQAMWPTVLEAAQRTARDVREATELGRRAAAEQQRASKPRRGARR